MATNDENLNKLSEEEMKNVTGGLSSNTGENSQNDNEYGHRIIPTPQILKGRKGGN